jgi:hypothetical protein
MWDFSEFCLLSSNLQDTKRRTKKLWQLRKSLQITSKITTVLAKQLYIILKRALFFPTEKLQI